MTNLGVRSVNGECQLPPTSLPNALHRYALVIHRTVIPEWGYRESILIFAR
ncbi:hypothetical protein ACM25P_12710 [Vreelandella alkaliphila]|uniref:hypothetical protein n=1 Tax=Vreelandella alkaliphila TaxID=272774 RepID=UPI0039F5BB05